MQELQFFDCEQNSIEWFEARAGIVTASEMKNLLTQGKGGKPSETRLNYLRQKAAELFTGRAVDTGFNGNRFTEMGHELEAEAVDLFESQTGLKTYTVGFLKRGDVGASPDRLIEGQDLGLEIKCKLAHNFLEVALSGEVPKEHIAQIQGNLWVTGFKKWYFVCYCPGFPLFVKVVERDEEYISKLEEAHKQFKEDLNNTLEQIQEFAVSNFEEV